MKNWIKIVIILAIALVLTITFSLLGKIVAGIAIFGLSAGLGFMILKNKGFAGLNFSGTSGKKKTFDETSSG